MISTLIFYFLRPPPQPPTPIPGISHVLFEIARAVVLLSCTELLNVAWVPCILSVPTQAVLRGNTTSSCVSFVTGARNTSEIRPNIGVTAACILNIIRWWPRENNNTTTHPITCRLFKLFENVWHQSKRRIMPNWKWITVDKSIKPSFKIDNKWKRNSRKLIPTLTSLYSAFNYYYL